MFHCLFDTSVVPVAAEEPRLKDNSLQASSASTYTANQIEDEQSSNNRYGSEMKSMFSNHISWFLLCSPLADPHIGGGFVPVAPVTWKTSEMKIK